MLGHFDGARSSTQWKIHRITTGATSSYYTWPKARSNVSATKIRIPTLCQRSTPSVETYYLPPANDIVPFVVMGLVERRISMETVILMTRYRLFNTATQSFGFEDTDANGFFSVGEASIKRCYSRVHARCFIDVLAASSTDAPLVDGRVAWNCR